MLKTKTDCVEFTDDHVSLDLANSFLDSTQKKEARRQLRAQVREISLLDNLIDNAFEFHLQGNLKYAVVLYEKVLGVYPKHFDALYLLGTACLQDKQYLNAVTFFSRALQVNPNDSASHNHLGIALVKLNLQDLAIVSFTKAIELAPNDSSAYSNRGLAYAALNQYEYASRDYKVSTDLNPFCAQTHFNCGIAHRELNNLDAALKSYEQALKITPDDPEIILNKSMLHILKGDFKRGWPLYEVRWKAEKILRGKTLQPLRSGQITLEGKTILLYAEQGLGDTIQFCRYAELVAKQGAKVILEVQPTLVKLLKNLAGVSQIIADGDPLPHFDFQCPMMSLPLIFSTETSTIPPITLTLDANNKKFEKWQSILGPKTKPRVGLAWSGSQTHANDQNRSIDLVDLIANLPKDIQYVSLQKDLRKHDIQTFQQLDHLVENETILHFGHLLNDFTDTAALCQSMDLIVSVDTSVAHLAASLQKPTWILLPFAPDWRWLIEHPYSSPWYPTLKLMRQMHKGDWKSLLALLEKDLQGWLRSMEKSVAITTQSTDD